MEDRGFIEANEALSRSPIFSSLTMRDLSALSEKSYRTNYRENQVIFEKGDPGQTLYVIVSGMIKILLRSPRGNEAVLAILLPGDFFGELSLLDGQPRSASAIAMEATETVVLHRKDLLEFLKAHPDVAISMLAILSSRLRQADEFVGDAVFLDIPARVAKKLTELAHHFGHRVAGSAEIDLVIRQQELAAMVGTTRESVNRALAVLEQTGAIKLEKQKIVILSAERLMDVVQR